VKTFLIFEVEFEDCGVSVCIQMGEDVSMCYYIYSENIYYLVEGLEVFEMGPLGHFRGFDWATHGPIGPVAGDLGSLGGLYGAL
jgi:hypothetical protein